MKKDFSFYEFVGVIAPGSVLLIILVYLFPGCLETLEAKQLSIGGFGVFIIIAYVLGQLIQAIGNFIENIYWWFWGGVPSFWITRKGKCDYLSSEQLQIIPKKIERLLDIEITKSLDNFNEKQWFAITRQIFAAIKQSDGTERLENFNAIYGLFRGIAASFATGFVIMTFKTGFSHYEFQLIIVTFFIMAIFRMHRFAIHYARELYVQFLQLE